MQVRMSNIGQTFRHQHFGTSGWKPLTPRPPSHYSHRLFD
jgi:hypothetical protein